MTAEKIGLVGLGYVGMPLAAAFAGTTDVIGFDTDPVRVHELKQGIDRTGELQGDWQGRLSLQFTTQPEQLAECTAIIITVPTPVTKARMPDLSCLENASETVGRILRKGMVVIYESTVYPGVTEDVCLPILERYSGLKLGDFDLGYSPERINPGDREHTVTKIKKIVSGHNTETLQRISALYGSVIEAGIHKAPSIKTAEAAKVIENVQRDLNIALMNELSKIFSLIGLDTAEVLEAAGTKWNFHRYHPGLVGGHCIGVDPYYLTHKAMELGYHPEVILAGRRINDSMGSFAAEQVIHGLVETEVLPQHAHVWVLGLTFKENVPDFRNSKASDLVDTLLKHGVTVSVWEPLVEPNEIMDRFGYNTLDYEHLIPVDAVVLVNGHDVFKCIDLEHLASRMRHKLLIDLKGFFDKKKARELGFRIFSL